MPHKFHERNNVKQILTYIFMYTYQIHVARWVHSFLWVLVWVSASQRIPLFALKRNPHKGVAREISCETGRRRRKARSQTSEQKKAVNRSRGKATVRERRLISEQLAPVDSEARSANARGWTCVPGGCVGISLGYTLVIARCTQKCHKRLPSCTWTQPKSVLVCSSFLPPSQLCMLSFVCKAMWNTPGRRWEKLLDNRMAMN